MVQFGGARFHPGRVSLLAPVALIVFVICVGAVFVPLLGLAVSAVRQTMSRWRGSRRRLRAAANSELRSRALMSELCPHGWRAQITVVHGAGERATDSAGGEHASVTLDWTELEEDSARSPVVRRVLAPTIGEALEAMVAGRLTDETLEQIERRAVADGALWPEP